MTVSVVAVERNPSAAPVEAILREEGKKGVKIIRWWGGMSWETLMTTNVDELLEHEPSYRPLDFDLPENWEDGYLEPSDEGVKFVYGPQPKRKDWESKRWSRRLLARLRGR